MKKMTRFAMLAFLIAAYATRVFAAEPDNKSQRDESAKQVAKTWLISLMQGETAVTTSLSAIPFSWDGKHKVNTHAELKSYYDGIVDEIGKKSLTPTSVKVAESSPKSVVVQIMVEGDDETIAITVRPGEASFVVGFVD